ncbi:hypothetical protein CK503_11190 [Aliifodinibius salipaludis]|uniref:PNPLA domain-containing protein n=1 Tax=Fodinibius salipaludis TaxID=2032627 RepID=A0A2A2G8S9_9BACT|nr:patatin-like phospholipase family protein [Aliifodinibius salipaludis]PAU93708.1 hypothetical protein CK503_11190 [Aliifodinibius salipaludis]
MPNKDIKIGLALSGGGFRASAFHLGVLKRLEELKILPHLSNVSVVSGGAITGGLYALKCANHGNGHPGSYPINNLIRDLRPVFEMNLRRSFLWGSTGRTLKTLKSFVSKNTYRNTNFVNELNNQLFNYETLDKLPDWILINATNLTTGKNWKFFSDRVGDYLIGATDKTGKIQLAEAVASSAAYPIMVDPYPFKTNWEDLKFSLLDNRWRQPPKNKKTNTSQWRKRFGKAKGKLTLPIVDGGLYDNLGLNSLQSSRVTHAIYSSSSTLQKYYGPSNLITELLREIGVVHERLGNVSKQHIHEMTHAYDPSKANKKLKDISKILSEKATEHHDSELDKVSKSINELSKVGFPPRGHQFKKYAPIQLIKTDLATNRYAEFDPPYDVPENFRGLSVPLVKELARVRTDLDAYQREVTDLLMVQGYFLTDAQIKVSMPEVINFSLGTDHPLDVTPKWDKAHEVISKFNGNIDYGKELLINASKRKPILGNSL